MKRKLLILATALIFMTGTAKIYAEANDTTLIALIKEGIQRIGSVFAAKSDQDMAGLKEKYKAEISKLVDDISRNASNNLSMHEKKEIQRADQELKAYLNDVKQQTTEQSNLELENVKKQITDIVNRNIAQIQNELKADLEKQLQEKLH
ncbi:hypothetical protein [Ferviditalea candida]|uniref:Uncharacterized protein n=1 Tax=Ferviditalea candida TaxID=3108399 RepID=A0ABU5ZEE4_9BACL|nr:hypothetical protein [Paenibacillaceae bacterium T2]